MSSLACLKWFLQLSSLFLASNNFSNQTLLIQGVCGDQTVTLKWLSQSCRDFKESNGVIAFFFQAPTIKATSNEWWCCVCVCAFMQDKQEIPWWLGVSYKGIGQYDLQDKLKPRKVGWCLLSEFFCIHIKNLRKQDITCCPRCKALRH